MEKSLKCARCHDELEDCGAIVLSPPSTYCKTGTAAAYHVCARCWAEWLEPDLEGGAPQEEAPAKTPRKMLVNLALKAPHEDDFLSCVMDAKRTLRIILEEMAPSLTVDRMEASADGEFPSFALRPVFSLVLSLDPCAADDVPEMLEARLRSYLPVDQFNAETTTFIVGKSKSPSASTQKPADIH